MIEANAKTLGLLDPGPALTLTRGKAHAVTKGHPWVYSNQVNEIPKDLRAGQTCPLQDTRGRFLGHGITNPESNILWRRFTSDMSQTLMDETWLAGQIKRAVIKRQSNPFCRIIWSDADSIPGLIVDRFGDVLVVQSVTAAIDLRLDWIAKSLNELLQPREIVFRCDAPIRSHEGLESMVRTHSGNPLPPDWYTIDGLDYYLDLEAGQKTGFYLDQRSQHSAVAKYSAGKTVLDVCCNQGAFALHCARAGAKSVEAIDISESCIEATESNTERNQLDITTLKANAFDFFKNQNRKWDLIILDPPSFARNRKSVPGAMRGYKELNLRALQSLNPGGILATYSCSHHVHEHEFFKIVSEAAADARKNMQILEWAHQPLDHPVLLNFPESQYLKGLILQLP
ncbi:MAG: class I SAM-dependent rRNA methyltransferase [Opitutales bacterium]